MITLTYLSRQQCQKLGCIHIAGCGALVCNHLLPIRDYGRRPLILSQLCKASQSTLDHHHHLYHNTIFFHSEMGLQLSPSDPVTEEDVCELNLRLRTFPTELHGVVHQDSLKRVRCFFIIALCPGPGGRWQVITYSGGHLWVTRVKREVSEVSRHTERTLISGSPGSPKSCSQVGQPTTLHTNCDTKRCRRS